MAGFVCSMVWIAAIANEVVSVLLALGEIMGLSEAIIGLTSMSLPIFVQHRKAPGDPCARGVKRRGRS
jgi:hypothetical protein